MEKIAIISDIHGNLEALNAVLEDIKEKKASKIFCIGDIIAKGVHIEECVNIIKQKCDIVLKGNCEDFFCNVRDIDFLDDVNKKRYIFNREKLSNENIEYLRKLPYSYEFNMSGRLVRIFHASPYKINEVIINEYSIEDKYKMFLPSENTLTQEVADMVIYGHIHHQYMDKLYNKTLINTGSVGNSFDVIRNPLKDSKIYNTTQAHYIILTGDLNSTEESGISISFESVKYDMEKELKNQDGNIEKDDYLYEMNNGLYRNMTKIKKGYLEHGIDMNKF